MSGVELAAEFKLQADAMKRKYDSFKKFAYEKRDEATKQKRRDELSSIWARLYQLTVELEALEQGDVEDPCFALAKESAKTTYKRYLADLVKDYSTRRHQSESPDSVILGLDDMDDQNIDSMVSRFVNRQQVRAESIKKSINEVMNKQFDETPMSSAYCKIKLKGISDAWQRMQLVDENYELDQDILPLAYVQEMEQIAIGVEETLIILQESLDGARTSTSHSNDGLKLQRIEIPKFAGDYFKWVTFRDLFTALVIENQSFKNAQRMHILKTNLVPNSEADTLTGDLTVSDANFRCAWTRLTKRYDNNRVVVYKYLAKFLDQKAGATEAKSVKKILDTTDQVMLALENLGRPVKAWDDWIVLITTQKLSEEVHKDWEKKIGTSSELPTWNQLKEFLEEEFRIYEGIEHTKKSKSDNSEKPKTPGTMKSYQTSTGEVKEPCPACNGNHIIFSCKKFKEFTVPERYTLAKEKKLCFSCLRCHTDTLRCDKEKPCKKFSKRHSTWLHTAKSKESTATRNSSTKEITSAFGAVVENQKQVLLATALIRALDAQGMKKTLRVLLDSGSQGSMITSQSADGLQLEKFNTPKTISCLGGSNTKRIQQVHLQVSPRVNSDVVITVSCYVLKKLTKTLPDTDLDTSTWNHLNGLKLADPTFNKMGRIDALFGLDVISDILQGGLIKGPSGTPMAQQTVFGWTVSGKIDPTHSMDAIRCFVATEDDVLGSLSRFWEIEELNPQRIAFPDEQECEKFYQKTVTRASNGKFTVKIPFKTGQLGPERSGTSKGQAIARLLQLEKRFVKDDKFKADYTQVMQEYIAMGHMVPADNLLEHEKLYYIPHHGVVKSDSLTTKMRVVFDASAKTSSGISLNECMHTGQKQQKDLMDILVKWRKHKIVFKADIAKMYRMINLDKSDQRYHTILWREGPTGKMKDYDSDFWNYSRTLHGHQNVKSIGRGC